MKRSYEYNTLAFEVNGTHVLLMGEQNVPPSPLIGSIKLSFLEKHDAIEEVYFVMSLPTLLSSNDVDVRNDVVVYDANSSATHKQVNVNDKKILSNHVNSQLQ